jgi:hypothetical protein
LVGEKYGLAMEIGLGAMRVAAEGALGARYAPDLPSMPAHLYRGWHSSKPGATTPGT